MSNLDLLKSHLRLGTATAVVAAFGAMTAPAVLAQDSGETADEDESVEEVVVTGSRIRRSGFDTTEPILVLDAQLINDRQFTNIGDLLNETPAFGAPTASPDGRQGGFAIGQQVVNFLGLGANRTLTVVNGRRFIGSTPPVPGGTTTGTGAAVGSGLQVDLNVIPTALIERVETLILGGAPVYGSDGIAGVINVILKDDYEGFRVSGQYGLSDSGDGDSYNLETTFGGNFADGRGNAVINVQYNVQNGLAGGERPFFFENQAFTARDPDTGERRVLNADRSGRGFITSGVADFGGISVNGATFLPVIGLGAAPDGRFFEFDENGNAIDFISGTRVPGQGVFFAFNGSGSDLFDNVEQILTESERVNISGLAHYDITDNVRAFGEFIFNNSEAIESSQQDDLFGGAFGLPERGGFVFGLDTPFLSNQARSVLTEAGATSFGVTRFLGPILGGGENTNESFTWRVVGGLEGEFEFGGRDFFWGVSGTFGQVDLETQGDTAIIQSLISALDAVALTDADLAATTGEDGVAGSLLNSTFIVRDNQTVTVNSGDAATAPRAGDIICRSVLETAQGIVDPVRGLPLNGGLAPGGLQGIPSAPFINGCVPLNVFGNLATPEAVDFVSALNISSSDLQQRIYQVNFGGDLFDLPGGTVSFSTDYVSRKEEGNFTPGGFERIGLDQNSPSAAGGGSFSTDEIGVEVLIPIIGDDQIPFVDSLTFEPKVRYVNNSIAGTDYTYTLGGRLSLFDNLIAFRGGFTQSIRSPSIQEVFDPTVGTFGFVTDPCDMRNIDAGPEGADPNSNRRRNCAAIGITDPDNFTSTAVNLSIPGQTFGNPDLRNEVADSYSVGTIITPDRWVPGLQISADFFSIKIDDRISEINEDVAIQACFDSSAFPEAICNAHTRDADNQVVFFSNGFQNASDSEFEAVQANLRYDFNVADAVGLVTDRWKNSDLGDFRFNANVFRRITDVFRVTEANQIINRVGRVGREKWTGNFDFTYNYDKFRLFWRVNYTQGLDLDVQDRENFTFFDADGDQITSLTDRFLHNATLNYQFTDVVSGSVTVNNVFDRRGTLTERAYHEAFGQLDFAEVFGRSFNFRLTAQF